MAEQASASPVAPVAAPAAPATEAAPVQAEPSAQTVTASSGGDALPTEGTTTAEQKTDIRPATTPLDDEQKRWAEMAGLDADTLAAMGTRAVPYIEKYKRSMSALVEKIGQPIQPQQQAAPVQEPQVGDDFDLTKPIEFSLPQGEFAEEDAERIQAHVLAPANRAINSLRTAFMKQQQQLSEVLSERAAEAEVQGHVVLDGLFSKYGQGFEEFSGKGSSLQMDRRSSAYRNRLAIRDNMAALLNSGFQSTDPSVPREEAAFRMAFAVATEPIRSKKNQDALKAQLDAHKATQLPSMSAARPATSERTGLMDRNAALAEAAKIGRR